MSEYIFPLLEVKRILRKNPERESVREPLLDTSASIKQFKSRSITKHALTFCTVAFIAFTVINLTSVLYSRTSLIHKLSDLFFYHTNKSYIVQINQPSIIP